MNDKNRNTKTDITDLKNIKNLEYIGTKLSDFEEIYNNQKKYYLLDKDNFSYIEKMKSKKDHNYYVIKKIYLN